MKVSPYLKPRLLIILMLGFSSGLPLALTGATLTIWLSDAGVTITTIGLFASVGTPYALKFLWAPLIDGASVGFFTRIFGQRRGWMILTQALLMASICAMALVRPDFAPWLTALLALCIAAASATQDIAIDAYRVEILSKDEQPMGAAMVTLGYRIGMVVSGAGALYLAEFYSWKTAYLTMAALVALGMATVLFCREPAQGSVPHSALRFTGMLAYLAVVGLVGYYAVAWLGMAVVLWGGLLGGFALALWLKRRRCAASGWFAERVIEPFADFMKREQWWLILLFIITYKLGDAFLGIMTGPFLREIGFSKTDIASVVKLYGFVATILGSFVGASLVARAGLIRPLYLCGIFHAITNLMFVVQAHVGADIRVLALGISLENFSGGMSAAVFVAFISMLCKREYTATQYALLSSLAAIARTNLSAAAGWTAASLGWEMFFILSVLLAIPSLIMLRFIRFDPAKASAPPAAST